MEEISRDFPRICTKKLWKFTIHSSEGWRVQSTISRRRSRST